MPSAFRTEIEQTPFVILFLDYLIPFIKFRMEADDQGLLSVLAIAAQKQTHFTPP
jgi:hypothetical protein